MGNVSEIKEQLNLLNTALTLYIAAHDAVFQQRLGEDIDYSSLSEKLNSSIDIVTIVGSKFVNLLDETHIAVRYTKSLIATQEQLNKIISNLRGKSEGNGYGFFAYQSDIKKYKSLEKEYYNLGIELNTWYLTLS